MHERHKWKTRAATMKPVKFQNIDMMCVSGVVALFAQVLSRTVLRYMQFRIVSDRDGVCVCMSAFMCIAHCSAIFKIEMKCKKRFQNSTVLHAFVIHHKITL